MKSSTRQPPAPAPPGDDHTGGTHHPASAAAAASADGARGVTRPGRAKPGGRSPGVPELRRRLAEAEETLRAIRCGEVDALVTIGENGPQVFTLEGAEHAYRVLIESMNEGALTLASDATVLYANQCFARMAGCPLEQVTGGSFLRFFSATDRAALRLLVKRTAKAGCKIQLKLQAVDGSQMPVQISLRPLASKGANRATIGLVVTDMTEARRSEELLRTLTHRVVQAQETERRRVALELHDHITQLVCATLLRSQALVNQLPAHESALKQEAVTLREMLGQTAEEVVRISRGLQPGVLDELGLAVVLRATTKAFTERTGVPVKLTCAPLPERLPADTELTLYRILQEALKNVEQHARAHRVTVRLTKPEGAVRLLIHDDGIGFDPEQQRAGSNREAGLGLLRMRERAIYSGGVVKVKSTDSAGAAKTGTTIDARLPLDSSPGLGGALLPVDFNVL